MSGTIRRVSINGSQVMHHHWVRCSDRTLLCSDRTASCTHGTLVCSGGTPEYSDGTRVCSGGTLVCSDRTLTRDIRTLTCRLWGARTLPGTSRGPRQRRGVRCGCSYLMAPSFQLIHHSLSPLLQAFKRDSDYVPTTGAISGNRVFTGCFGVVENTDKS